MTYSPTFDQSRYLSVLCQSDPKTIKAFTEDKILPQIETVKTIKNRVGSIAVPIEDAVTSKPFILGEALTAEAEIEADGITGYAAVLGRDLELAIAIALVDACVQGNRFAETVEPFVLELETKLLQEEEQLMKKVQSTQVKMETFEW